MAKRGRPVKSIIRQNMTEVLFYLKKAYGYQIHKHYNKIFDPVTRESVYYNLKKGLSLGEFELIEVKQEKGNYSWGTAVEKRYYILGPNAKVQFKREANDYFSSSAHTREQTKE